MELEQELHRLNRFMERIAKSLGKIEEHLDKQSGDLGTLCSCAEVYPNGKSYFNVDND